MYQYCCDFQFEVPLTIRSVGVFLCSKMTCLLLGLLTSYRRTDFSSNRLPQLLMPNSVTSPGHFSLMRFLFTFLIYSSFETCRSQRPHSHVASITVRGSVRGVVLTFVALPAARQLCRRSGFASDYGPSIASPSEEETLGTALRNT